MARIPRSRYPDAARDRRVLDDAGGFGAMTWVMAIMLFLTVLAAALGLGTGHATRQLDRQLSGRLTVQVVVGDPARHDALAVRALSVLRGVPGVVRATPVPRAELERLLAPWLGGDAADPALPVPAMIDVDLAADGDGTRVAAAMAAVDPAIRVDRHEAWMSPVSGFMTTMTLLAAALVVLMAVATGAVVLLAARAGLETHRETISVMHMLGSTDVQVARLFQRRIALDAAIGGAIGGVAALAVVLFLGLRLQALGSELLGGVTLGAGDWILLALLPVFFVLLAMLAARIAVLGTLKRVL